MPKHMSASLHSPLVAPTTRPVDVLFSAALALCVSTGTRIIFDGDIHATADKTVLAPISGMTVFVFALVLIAAIVCARVVRRRLSLIEGAVLGDPHRFSLRAFLLCVLAMLLCWSPYMLALYPGVVLPDTLASVGQIIGDAELSNHHPVLFTFLLGAFLKLPVSISVNMKVFLFSLFQATMLATTASTILAWCRTRGLKAGPFVACIVFFCLCPVFPLYAVNVQKDAIHAMFCVLLSLCAVEWRGERRQCLPLFATLLMTSLTRSNGVLASAATIGFLLAFAIRDKERVRATIGVAVAYALAFFISNALILSIAKPTERSEVFGMPLQQLSRVVVCDGAMSDGDLAFMNKLLPLDEYKECYVPTLVNHIKWADQFDEQFLSKNSTEFVALWLRNLPGNLGIYADAFILETFGFWVPGFRHDYGYMDDQVQGNDFGIERRDLSSRLFGGSFASNLVAYRWFIGSGTLLWIVLFGLWLALAFRRYRTALLYVPALASVLAILMATPVAFSLRYVFVLALGLPLYVFGGVCGRRIE